MPASVSRPFNIAIYGLDKAAGQRRAFGLWPPGYAASVTAAGGTPVSLSVPKSTGSWDKALKGVDGVLLLGSEPGADAHDEKRLCEWCRKRSLPLLAVDDGLHVLNRAFGGTLHLDLPLDLPQALQHRHPPERGLRHAVVVARDTLLAQVYGEGEIVVNSEHRRAVNRVGRGLRVSASALDGVIEAVEAEDDDWFALGVQWQPAAASASGLDIQLFRGLVDACLKARSPAKRRLKSSAA